MAAANVATSLPLVFILAMGSRYLDGMGVVKPSWGDADLGATPTDPARAP
jgi:hypothetical protein